MHLYYSGVAAAALLLASGGVYAADVPAVAPAVADVAQKFGARDHVIAASLSPDGSHVAYIIPGKGKSTIAVVSTPDGLGATPLARADGEPLHLQSCDWSAADRIVCKQYGIAMAYQTIRAPFTRTVGFDIDGKNMQMLGHRDTMDNTRISQFDGEVVDWLSGTDGTVLMARDYVPQSASAIGSSRSTLDGMGVDLVDTRTGKGKMIEAPKRGASDFLSDGRGVVRIMSAPEARGEQGLLTGTTVYYYRLANDRNWKVFSRDTPDGNEPRPIAVDGEVNAAYALKKLDGRDALYRVALDGSMKAELVYANPIVDVSGVVTIGRGGRVIGARYVTDRRQVEYFDPAYSALAKALAKALPQLPLIYFISASTDEKKLLIFAGSDVDAGHYYYFDKATRHLDELTPARPALDGMTLSPQRSISYPAADGKTVPAYLTLPPGSDGKHVPLIVMPHGGPASRDEWGFDWLAQFFAQRGFAVLQPEFRGSSGYGDGWYVDNGFKSWKVAMSDIADGARWAVKGGIADADRMAIVGWSYGGYAALQSNVVEPSLFKAVVAIAPVTDLGMMKQEAEDYTSARVVSRYVGSGPHIEEGSPARHADRFQAPVLMFHGDQDINVDIAEARAMDKALRRAGKQTELVIFKGLDHQLDDSDARAQMLAKADGFLRANLKMP